MFSKSIYGLFRRREASKSLMTEWKIYNIINKEYTIMFLLLFALTIGLITYKASKTILVSKVGLFISE